jgi:glyoxylase-like metal-dependent hydrolase (beta-lactamase superfamily II)
MKLRTSLLLIPLLLLASNVHAELTKLSDNVYAYVGSSDASPSHSFAANAGIVIGSDSVLVVDTLISAKEGERFLADIRKVTPKPIKYVVNTHTHLDHALGNCVFAKLGATVVSQVADRDYLAASGARIIENAGHYGLTAEEMAGTEIALPTLAFGDKLEIDLGGERVILLHPAPSHTAGSLVVLIPRQKLLFAGDILFTDFHPFLADGDFAGWEKSLDALLALDVERIVPGHGPLSGKPDLLAMKEYLVLFDKSVRELAAQGLSAEAINAELLKRLPKRSLAEWMVGFNVRSRYQKNQCVDCQ